MKTVSVYQNSRTKCKFIPFSNSQICNYKSQILERSYNEQYYNRAVLELHYGPTDKTSPAFYRTLSLWDRCPAYNLKIRAKRKTGQGYIDLGRLVLIKIHNQLIVCFFAKNALSIPCSPMASGTALHFNKIKEMSHESSSMASGTALHCTNIKEMNIGSSSMTLHWNKIKDKSLRTRKLFRVSLDHHYFLRPSISNELPSSGHRIIINFFLKFPRFGSVYSRDCFMYGFCLKISINIYWKKKSNFNVEAEV